MCMHRPAQKSTGVLLSGLLVCCLAGCEGDPYHVGRRVPVRGQIYLGDKPLWLGSAVFGRVWFYPDASKGNTCPQVPVGEIEPNGEYQLKTRGQDGAPPGWYKVLVVATERIDHHYPSRPRKCFVPLRYTRLETTDLQIEVLNDGQEHRYDLHLKPDKALRH